jgi:clusterin-associated protein 1
LDLLDKEKGLKASREAAIEYLDGLSNNYDSSKDQEVEKKIMKILSGQEKALEQLDTRVNDLKQNQNELTQELQVKKVELERAEKRLESLHHAAPSHQSELNQYETDLATIYKIYVEKIRNHDYLQFKLEKYQKLEENSKKSLKGLIAQNQAMEQENIHDNNEIIEYQEPEQVDNVNVDRDDVEMEGDEFDDDDEHF